MERWDSGVIDRMTKKLLVSHNLKVIDEVNENGKVANILESNDNKRRFIFTARSYMWHPAGDIVSGINKRAVDESIKKNWTLLFGFQEEGMVYELDANSIAKIYKDKVKYEHNQWLFDDVSFKNISALNWNPARRRNMNKPETLITNLCKENNIPLMYTGDGRFPISNLVPDWIVVGQNKVVDFFGKYWHLNEDEDDRRKIFETEGYKYLVIWEGEEKNMEQLLNKIKDFVGRLNKRGDGDGKH